MKITKLRNGITVVTERFPRAASVAIEIGIDYGGIDTVPRMRGVAHFIEHMLFKGTKKRGWKEIRDDIEKLGGYMNAYTSHEYTGYHALLPAEHLDTAMDVLSDMIVGSVFNKEEMEKEKTVVVSDINRIYDVPQRLVHFLLPTVLYKKHPVRYELDKKEITESFTRDQVMKVWKDNYTAENIVIVAAGNIGHEDVVKKAEKGFAAAARGARMNRRLPRDDVQRRRTKIVKKVGLKESHIAIGYKCCDIHSKDKFAVAVMTEMLSMHLHEEIREKRGLGYATYATDILNETFGYIYCYADTSPENEAKVKNIMLKEIKKMHSGDISEKEFRERRAFLRNSYRIKVERTDEAASEILDLIMIGQPDLFKEYPDKIASVTISDVKRVARRYLLPDKHGMLIIRPKKRGR